VRASPSIKLTALIALFFLIWPLLLVISCFKVNNSRITGVITTSNQTVATTGSENISPIEVVSVTGPWPPTDNPGGYFTEIILGNTTSEPIISLTAALNIRVESIYNPYLFGFNVTSANPLLPGQTASYERVVEAGYQIGVAYPLTINITFIDGKSTVETQQVIILEPNN
jgi:hypothetical protein